MKPVAPTLMDRFLAGVAPTYAQRRYHARLSLNMMGQYAGAKSNRAALKAWRTNPGSADADSLGDLPTLRSRSRDLTRNNPIAAGARSTERTNIVGTGLRVRAKLNHKLLGITEEAAEAWERRAETLFDLWASSKLCDITLTQNFYEQQGLVFNTTFESGDAFVMRRTPKKRGSIVPLALGIIEADQCGTPDELKNDYFMRDGVRIDEDAAPISYTFFVDHPGDSPTYVRNGYREVPAYGAKSGEQMVLHVFDRQRPGQSRGVPQLAPVIELLKQLDRYSEAELMKAVVSSFFTVFLKTESGEDGFASALPQGAYPGWGQNDVAMGPGTIVDIGTNEEIQTAQPANTSNFDPFFQAVVRQIGVALSIPFELLMMHFTASYSASRASLEMAAQFFRDRRVWLVRNFCAPVYEWFISDAINAGLIEAPGFYNDPVKRAAWLGAQWIGPARIILDPLKEWKAETEAVNLGARTIEQVIIERGGDDFEQTTAQRVREHKARSQGGLEPETLAPSGPGVPEPKDDQADPAEKGKPEPKPKPKNEVK
ncbi:phage portal protein [Rhodopseudomonas palustris]|uniref:phage portal protein n=1 Tax=Rhodopseudomonas palustris TaxID=1076 RepID=UPI000641E46C|nr:phage portal protein [Rhodopseudomonas palustris]